MRSKWTVLLIAGTLLSGGAARAQLGSLEKPVSLGLRAGGFFPQNRPSGAGKTWLAAGIDARINVPFLPVVGGQEVAIDYLARGGRANVLGVTLVQRYVSPSIIPGQPKPYFGLGFGVYRVHAKETVDTGEGTVEHSDTKTGPGVKAVAGIDFKGGFYLQGDYHYPITSKVAGTHGRGLAITAGLRF